MSSMTDGSGGSTLLAMLGGGGFGPGLVIGRGPVTPVRTVGRRWSGAMSSGIGRDLGSGIIS